jgi:hypothetical protein
VTGTGRGDASAEHRQASEGSWRASAPELAAAAFGVLVTALAVYAYAGADAAVAVVAGCGVAAIAYLRMLLPAVVQPDVREILPFRQATTSFLGVWRKRVTLRDATARMASYDAELRPALQHLLAARLAQRHGVSLYADPAAARRLLLPGPRDDALWFWLDPGRQAETDPKRPGIPPRSLAAILDRLERL